MTRYVPVAIIILTAGCGGAARPQAAASPSPSLTATTMPAPPPTTLAGSPGEVSSKSPTDLWESAAARDACGDAFYKEAKARLDDALVRARAGEDTSGMELPKGAQIPACTEGKYGAIVVGTRLTVLTDRAECVSATAKDGRGPLVRVDVLSGKHKGKTGCVAQADVKLQAASPPH